MQPGRAERIPHADKSSFVSPRKCHFDKLLTEPEQAILSKFNIVVVLDRSGSMNAHDCGNSNGLSKVAQGDTRWDWTENELENLSRQSEKILPAGFDVITFNHDNDVFENCNKEQIGKIYSEYGPLGGTMLGPALDKAFNLTFKETKPLLVAIISDCDFGDFVLAEREIVNKLTTDKPGSTRFVFLRVGGNDFAGEEMLKQLQQSVRASAPANPSIATVNFPELISQGLGRSLVHAVQDESSKK